MMLLDALKNFYLYSIRCKWMPGFPSNSIESILAGEPLKIDWLKSDYKDRWFADPFILDVTDEYIILLVEEVLLPGTHGNIAKLTIDKYTHKLLKSKVVLQLDTHLSFPAIYRDGDNIYIYPENSASGDLNLYKYNSETECFEKIKKLCPEPLTDAIYTDVFGDKLLFSTKSPNSNGKILGIYKYDNTKQEFFYWKNIMFDSSISRGAGDFFKIDKSIYRPAQDCNDDIYGRALSIQSVERDQKGNFVIKEVRKVFSNDHKYKLGMHTLNLYKGVVVVDADCYERPLLGNFVTSLRRLFGMRPPKL